MNFLMPEQNHYQFAIRVLKETLNQVILIKNGEKPTEAKFKLNAGICLNSFNTAKRIIGEEGLDTEYKEYFDMMLDEAIYCVITHPDNAHMFSGCQYYPIKHPNPNHETTSEEFYRYSDNKYTPDVIDMRIKLTELVIAHLEMELNEMMEDET